jgi:hypothetical protein
MFIAEFELQARQALLTLKPSQPLPVTKPNPKPTVNSNADQ